MKQAVIVMPCPTAYQKNRDCNRPQTCLGKARQSIFFVFLLWLAFPAITYAGSSYYNAADNSVSALLILERGGFTRTYGLFTKGIGRVAFDDQSQTLDNVKLAFLLNGLAASSPDVGADLFAANTAQLGPENEIAFVQSEPLKFSGNTGKMKGDLVINNTRKSVVMDATLNRAGHINPSTKVFEDGQKAIGFSLHTTIKRGDFGLNPNGQSSPYSDDATLMFDVLAMGVK